MPRLSEVGDFPENTEILGEFRYVEILILATFGTSHGGERMEGERHSLAVGLELAIERLAINTEYFRSLRLVVADSLEHMGDVAALNFFYGC